MNSGEESRTALQRPSRGSSGGPSALFRSGLAQSSRAGLWAGLEGPLIDGTEPFGDLSSQGGEEMPVPVEGDDD